LSVRSTTSSGGRARARRECRPQRSPDALRRSHRQQRTQGLCQELRAQGHGGRAWEHVLEHAL